MQKIDLISNFVLFIERREKNNNNKIIGNISEE